jgi:uncharacterized protein (UPF0210 family)
MVKQVYKNQNIIKTIKIQNMTTGTVTMSLSDVDKMRDDTKKKDKL